MTNWYLEIRSLYEMNNNSSPTRGLALVEPLGSNRLYCTPFKPREGYVRGNELVAKSVVAGQASYSETNLKISDYSLIEQVK